MHVRTSFAGREVAPRRAGPCREGGNRRGLEKSDEAVEQGSASCGVAGGKGLAAIAREPRSGKRATGGGPEESCREKPEGTSPDALHDP